MKKFKLFFNAQKEERWLNEMLKQGWLLKKASISYVYTFQKTNNADQVICLDSQSFSSNKHFTEYKAFHEELGWSHLGGTQYSNFQYWLNPSSKDDSLFSDTDSEKNYLKRLTRNYGYAALILLFFTMLLYDNEKQYTNLKAAYFTPGLWEMEGTDFLISFLIESPFAIVRFSSVWLMLGFGLLFLYAYFKNKENVDKML